LWIDGKLCRLCLVTSRLGDVYRLGLDGEASRMLVELSNLVKVESRTEAFTRSFEALKVIAGMGDPYSAYKRRLREVGARVAVKAREYMARVGWRLEEALRISAAANIVDTSVLGYTSIDLEEAIWDKPALEERVEIPRGETVYLALDNAGEAEIGIVLAEALKLNGYEVKLVVRSESYEIDITKADIGEKLEFDVIETPGSKPPVVYIDGGYVIAKGIANLEASLETGRMRGLHLLRAKCSVLAELFNVPKNSPLIVTVETARRMLSKLKNPSLSL